MSEDSQIFVIKTTANQERSVATALARIAKKEKLDIRAILAPDELKGYVLVEAPKSGIVELAIQTIPHARALVKGSSSIAEIEHFLKPKPIVTGIKEGAIIEVTSGPFKGEKARVKRVDEGHEEITVELFDAVVPIPITIRGDTVRILEKRERMKPQRDGKNTENSSLLINKITSTSEWIERDLQNLYLLKPVRLR